MSDELKQVITNYAVYEYRKKAIGHDAQERVRHTCQACNFGWRQKLRRFVLTKPTGKLAVRIIGRKCPRCKNDQSGIPRLPNLIWDPSFHTYYAMDQLTEEKFLVLTPDILELVHIK